MHTFTHSHSHSLAVLFRKFRSMDPKARSTTSHYVLISIPLMWLVLQSYHLLVYDLFAQWLITQFPYLTLAPKAPHVAIASIFNLILFGTLAAIWPSLGLGIGWKPSRYQSLTLFFLVGGVFLAGHWLTFLPAVTNPFKSMGITMWTTTPIGEEILFRGFVYAWLAQRWQVRPEATFRQAAPMILHGALCFALWHLVPDAILQYGWQPIVLQVIWTFGAGILFGMLRHWTGSIWFTIPVHAAGNFVATLL